MTRRARIVYTDAQKAGMWNRWQVNKINRIELSGPTFNHSRTSMIRAFIPWLIPSSPKRSRLM